MNRYDVWEVTGEGDGAAWAVIAKGLTHRQAQHKAEELSKRLGQPTYVVLEAK
jgi:hypothetical protein